MFRQRTSSAKPGDSLLAEFRQQFPQVSTATSAAAAPSISHTAPPNETVAPAQISQSLDAGGFRDEDPTPRASNAADEPWRFTPGLPDTQNFNYGNFPNAPPGYYTPTPGGPNTLFHLQAGDLHSPTIALGHGLGTALSMPTSGDALQAGPAILDMSGFQTLQPHELHRFNPFIQASAPQQGFAPSSFVHQDTGYETMEQDGSPSGSDPSDGVRNTSIDSAFRPTTQMVPAFAPRTQSGKAMSHLLPPSAKKFRFHSTLNAPTAMIKQADEIPITYLNKGQAFCLTVADTHAFMPLQPGTKYRTFVRISFDDDERRQKPEVCWGLWKEGRGSNKAHLRGGRLQAVEYVGAGQPADGDDKRTRVELEYSSFDGFSLTWTPGSKGAPELSVALRFNFLSTDFSHLKGVKGIPVRLCTRTTPVGTDPAPPTDTDFVPNICYCKVKLFRDHGAQRKLSSDVAHVKKSIDKLKQQIVQAESGMKDFRKRKQSSASKAGVADQRPGKVQKHKRTWFMSSAISAGGGSTRMTLEEDLNFKLQILQDMFTSTRPVSVLYLKGEGLDDPDEHPVSLPGEQSLQTKTDGSSRDGASWQVRSGRRSAADSMASPSPSALSLASQPSAIGQGGYWQGFNSVVAAGEAPRADEPTKVGKTDNDGKLSGWIEALGVDQSYRPPPERTPKPVAWFYILNKTASEATNPQYYHAIYLMQRTLNTFIKGVASKWGLDSSRVLRTVRVLQSGLEVIVDEDVVRELKEGQDMTLEVEDVVEPPFPARREWEMAVEGTEEGATKEPTPPPNGLVLRLRF
ncbi:CP2 transcription factor domain-containing protein [Sarocladium implicatum]|nr:CP2 transcription factor domain-containing protein [Sarocladium implicatum]